jgi:serine/threonine protein kinase
MHNDGYAHIDINPTNIVIGPYNNLSKLINLGVMRPFNDKIVIDIRQTYKYMPNEISEIATDLYDIYSLDITFIECAFAFHYREQYIKIMSLQSSSLFDCVLRCVPPIKTESNTLNLYCHKLRRLDEIEYTGETVIYNIDDKTNYTLGALYTNIMDIHSKYPIFRKMIEIEPHKRYSIKNVISVCEKTLYI